MGYFRETKYRQKDYAVCAVIDNTALIINSVREAWFSKNMPSVCRYYVTLCPEK